MTRVAPSSAFPDIEAWAEHYVTTTELEFKLSPPAPPPRLRAHAQSVRIGAPGRPACLEPSDRKVKSPSARGLGSPRARAKALHTFLRHELQAAELMCWALLAFPETEPEFRRGLVGICQDEIRHMSLYREHIERLGFHVGDFGGRDWFWQRVPACSDALAFVSVMGMGFEAANLEHAPVFAARFRDVGDELGAQVQEQVAAEERAHVGFAVRWFRRWTGGCDFDTWSRALPAPLSPWVMQGKPLREDERLRAGMSPEFVQALRAFVPTRTGRQP